MLTISNQYFINEKHESCDYFFIKNIIFLIKTYFLFNSEREQLNNNHSRLTSTSKNRNQNLLKINRIIKGFINERILYRKAFNGSSLEEI